MKDGKETKEDKNHMAKLTTEEFTLLIYTACQARVETDLRLGQCYFNALYKIRPDLANQVRGHEHLDPFHKDDNLGAFMSCLYPEKENTDGEGKDRE